MPMLRRIVKAGHAPTSTLLMFCCGLLAGGRAAEIDCTITNAKGGGPLPEAVVSLVPLDHPAPPPPADAKAEIAQEGQEFYGYVTVVQAGTRVVFPNRDNVQHHVYSLSKPKKFEFPLYNPGQAEALVFEAEGLVTLGCNIHDWMIAYLLVVPTPWFAKSDQAGRLHVTAPAGRYRLEVWHPRLREPVAEEITLGDAAPAIRAFPLTLKPERRIRRATPGRAGGY